MTIFILYTVFLLGLGVFEYRRNRTPDAFFTAGRRCGVFGTAVSITASCVGGSATIGMAALAWEIGYPAFWWLGSGACGLLVLVVFLARKVRESGVRTMPEMIERYMGRSARPVAAVIVVAAWTAVAAAQFSAAGRITATMTGLPFNWAAAAGAAVIILYTLMGGQASVLRSDVYQYLLVFGGSAVLLAWLMHENPGAAAEMPFELLNPDFTLDRWTYFMLILGGSYVVCPMLFGRLLSARNEHCAVAGAGWGVVGIILSGLLITAVGIYCRGVVPAGTAGDTMLTSALTARLPEWLGIILLLALFSAVVSSADSCLVTASTIFANDLLRTDALSVCRASTLLIGVAGTVIALWGKGILALLLAANDIYVCGVVAPVFIAMTAGGRRRAHPGFMTAAMVLGGSFGLAAALTGIKALSYWGIAASILSASAGLLKIVPSAPGEAGGR